MSTLLPISKFMPFCGWFFKITRPYLNKNRFEVFSCFQQFHKGIKNQHDALLKFSNLIMPGILVFSFSYFCFANNNTLHETSCPHTPQQNGVVERNHLHMLEVTRCLFLRWSVPKTFWPEAVLTPCYLKNRMPLSYLNKKTPSSILPPNKLLLSLPPKVSGCVYFVHLFPNKKRQVFFKSCWMYVSWQS